MFCLKKISHNLPKEIIHDILHWKYRCDMQFVAEKKALQWPQESQCKEIYDTRRHISLS